MPAEPFTNSFCGFPILVNSVAKVFQKELKAPDGTTVFLATGSFKTTYTNVQTGKTISANETGPTTLTFFPDGSVTIVLGGNVGFFLAPADAQRFGLPTVSVLAGKLTVSIDSNGNLTSLSLNGHVKVNVCAALS